VGNSDRHASHLHHTAYKGDFEHPHKPFHREALVHAAHQVCPYSVATRGNMPVTLEILD
jgi:organic hydroperoxide reductase OsmC/OhrA